MPYIPVVLARGRPVSRSRAGRQLLQGNCLSDQSLPRGLGSAALL